MISKKQYKPDTPLIKTLKLYYLYYPTQNNSI